MSYADYSRHRPEPATCRLCGWSGEAGEDCDCEAMEEAERIAAVLREQEEADEDGTDEVQA
jgi:hypothetical protein